VVFTKQSWITSSDCFWDLWRSYQRSEAKRREEKRREEKRKGCS